MNLTLNNSIIILMNMNKWNNMKCHLNNTNAHHVIHVSLGSRRNRLNFDFRLNFFWLMLLFHRGFPDTDCRQTTFATHILYILYIKQIKIPYRNIVTLIQLLCMWHMSLARCVCLCEWENELLNKTMKNLKAKH